MFKWRKILIPVALLFCTSPMLLSGPASPPQDSVEQTVTLPLSDDFTLSLTKLLEFSSRTLDIPLLFEESLTSDILYQFTSKVEIPKAKYQGFFERLLLEKEFLYIMTGEGTAAIHSVESMSMLKARLQVPYAKAIRRDEVDDYADRGILISTVIPLRYIDARVTMTSLNPYFPNQSLESIRPVEKSNALIIRALSPKVHAVSKMIAEMDVDSDFKVKRYSEEMVEMVERIEALEEKLASIEK